MNTTIRPFHLGAVILTLPGKDQESLIKTNMLHICYVTVFSFENSSLAWHPFIPPFCNFSSPKWPPQVVVIIKPSITTAKNEGAAFVSHVGSVFFGLQRHKESVTMLRAILSIAHQEHEDAPHRNGQSLLYFTSACTCLELLWPLSLFPAVDF